MHAVHSYSGRYVEDVFSTSIDKLKEEEKSIIRNTCSAGEKVEQHRPHSTLVPLLQPVVTTAMLRL